MTGPADGRDPQVDRGGEGASAPSRRPGLDRRAFLTGAGAGSLGLAVGAGVAGRDLLRPAAAQEVETGPGGTYPFHGAHQAGIATPAQDHLRFAAFDLRTDDRREVASLLQAWTTAAERLCLGQPVASLDDDLLVPPADTGEAVGRGPNHLTITIGFGPGLFRSGGVDRYGLAAHQPAALADLPSFAGDQLDPSRSGGDLAVQACADDPLVAFHAVHALARLGRPTAVARWAQAGFGRTSSTTRAQDTPRNLMGMKDGTNNIQADDAAAMDRYVWVDGSGWLAGGSYLVARRIRILLELWDRTSLQSQEETIGRHKISGAPLGGLREFDGVDLGAIDTGGQPLIGTNAHIRLAAASTNDGERILRRGYSFDDGVDPSGEQDVGLFFVCFQRDPSRQFTPIQRQLAASDALNTYIRHTSSAVFACPPGVQPGGWIGQELLG